MAKSFDDRHYSDIINDDLIKDALKTGLTSIKASEDLVGKTLVKCRNEIQNGKMSRNRSFAFVPFACRIGVPLAAGALVLVLVLNNGSNLLQRRNTASAPQSSEMAIAALDNGASRNAAQDKNVANGSAEAAAPVPAPENAYSASLAPSESPASTQDMSEKGFTGARADSAAFTVQSLNSSLNRTQNNTESQKDSILSDFKAIVNQYNTVNNTKLTLDENGVTRIQTLPLSGVNSEMLLSAGSYQDVLSGGGYWFIPLKNANGDMDTILTVNTFEKGQNLSVSNQDLIVTVAKKEYIASAKPAALYGTSVKAMFDPTSVVNLIKAKGYKDITETVTVDINYGSDFIIFAKADGKELGLPFLNNEASFGLTNGNVYARDELFKIISENLKTQ